PPLGAPARRPAPADRPRSNGRLHHRRDRRTPGVRAADRGAKAGPDPRPVERRGAMSGPETPRLWSSGFGPHCRPGRAEVAVETPPVDPRPELDLALRIDAACTRFEAAWRDGESPSIEAYLAEFRTRDDDPSRLLYELLSLEVELLRGAGG